MTLAHVRDPLRGCLGVLPNATAPPPSPSFGVDDRLDQLPSSQPALSAARQQVSCPDLSCEHSGDCRVQTLQSLGPGELYNGGGDRTGPPRDFRSLLRQLESEHFRAVAELEDEVARLRQRTPPEQDSGLAVTPALSSVSEVEGARLSSNGRPGAGSRSLSPPRPNRPAVKMQSDMSTVNSDADIHRIRREESPPRNRSAGHSSQAGGELHLLPLLPTLPTNEQQHQPDVAERCWSGDSQHGFEHEPPRHWHRMVSSVSGEEPSSRQVQLLKVTISSARGLDVKGGSDPYCICSIVGKPDSGFQTFAGSLDDSSNLSWNYEAVLDEYTSGDSLEFVIKSSDWRLSRSTLGSATIRPSVFSENGFSGEVPLFSEEDCGAFLQVKIELAPRREDYRMRDAWIKVPRRQSTSSAEPAGKRALNYQSTAPTSISGEDVVPKVVELSKRVKRAGCWGVFDPSSGRRLAWDGIGIILVCWDVIWLPLQVFQPEQTRAITIVTWIAVVYWTLDILMTFNTGTYRKGGYLIMDRKTVALTYLRRWFFPDLLVVSCEWLLMTDTGSSEGAGAARAGRIARASRTVRLLRLMRLAKLRELMFSMQALIDSEWLTVMFILGKNLLTILVLTHVLACMWFLVGTSSDQGWVHQAGLADGEFSQQYLVSLQWSMAQFTPGSSPINSATTGERSYTCGVLAVGLIVATCFISTITSTVSSVWASQRNESTQAFLLKKFLRQNNISRSLGSRVTRYIDCVQELRQQKVHPTRVQYLSLLSGPLHVELLSELREPQVCIHKLMVGYKEASVCAFREICTTALQQNNFAKNDMLFHRKTEAKFMYFVNSGTLVYRRVLSSKLGHHSGPPDQLKDKVEVGQWCCENALWMPWQHAGDMKAVSTVDVTLLNVSRFCEVTNSDPEAYFYATAYCLRFMEKIHQAASFDAKAVSDLPLRLHVLGVDGGECLEPPRRRGVSELLTPAARFLQEAEDMEAELIAFPDPEPLKHRDSTKLGVGSRPVSPKRERGENRTGTFAELAQRALTPRMSFSRRRSRTATVN